MAHADVVQEIYAAFGRGDGAGILAPMVPSVRFRHPASTLIPWSGEFEGYEGVGRFLQALGEAVEVLIFEPRDFHESGDCVFVLGAETMRARSTGRTYSVDWCHVWRFEGRRVLSFTEFTDTAVIEAAFRA